MKLSFLEGSLVKDTFIYTLTDALSKAVTFLLLPFVSMYITPDELGMVTNFVIFSDIISLIAGLAIINAIPYLFYEQSKSENAKMVTYLLGYSLLICGIVTIIIVFFNESIYNKLGISVYLQCLAIPYIFFSLSTNINLIILRLENKAKVFSFFQLSRIILNLFMVILLVIVLKFGGRGKIFSDVLVVSSLSFFHIYMLCRKKMLTMELDMKYMKRLIKFGAPLMPHSLSSWLKSGVDKVFITSFCGLYQNGLYSMAISICQVYKLFNNSFENAYTPYLQKRLACITAETEQREKERIVKLTYGIWILFFLISLLTIVAAWFIINYVIDSKYQSSFIFVPWLILGYYIYAVYSMTIQFVYKMKKTLGLGIITFSGSIVQMIIGYYFIKEYGTLGAAYSSALGAFLISSVMFFYSNKVYRLPWFYFIK